MDPRLDVAYGPHPAQRLDFYPAGDGAPLYVYVHGGGFRQGDKAPVPFGLVDACRSRGVAVASINYRLSDVALYPAAMEDGVRALQFLRLHAEEFGLDPRRFAAGGGSAGAGIVFWIGLRPDFAKPDSSDALERQSTRLRCIASRQAQSTYSLPFIHATISRLAGTHSGLMTFFGLKPDEMETERAKRLFAENHYLDLVTPDAPPTCLCYTAPNVPLFEDKSHGVMIHHPHFGLLLKERMDAAGVECVIHQREDLPPATAPEDLIRHYGETMAEFVARRLRA